MKLISPRGARVSVRDEKGEYLLTQGYKLAPDEEPAPADEDKPKRRRTKKAE